MNTEDEKKNININLEYNRKKDEEKKIKVFL